MSGLLDTDFIKDLFGDVLGDIYGDGSLIRVNMERQSSGSIIPVKEQPTPIKIQVDVCTEAMRKQDGYADTDVALLILQSGVTGRAPNTDDLAVVRNETWKIYGVTQDPARSYWLMRGIRQATPAA